MRKAITIILVVAILGLLGTLAVSNSHHSSGAKNSSSFSTNYRDGSYIGSSAETPYGTVRISVVIKNHKISDVKFLKMPNGDDRSRQITSFAAPQLKQNTLRAQNTQIDFVSGATSTSFGYQESLQAALDKTAGALFIPSETSVG